jgi:hypothetical protein
MTRMSLGLTGIGVLALVTGISGPEGTDTRVCEHFCMSVGRTGGGLYL